MANPPDQVEAAKLMRQAADILSSAPAMQIRYLEAMQAMAKSANSKVIFLPGASQTMPNSAAMSAAIANNSDPFAEGSSSAERSGGAEYGGDQGFQQAMNARVIENI
jgi:erythrocyte band 7 integral membrane protein